MIITMCCTKNWYKYLLVDIFALLSTNDVKKMYLFIEDDELKGLDELKEFNVEFVVINYKKVIDKYITPNNKNKTPLYTEATLIRLIMCNYMDEDKVLYIDTDTCVIGDINELWNMDLKDNYVAAVKETDAEEFLEYFESINIEPTKYVNAGILLMNNKKIKEDNIYKKWLSLLNKNKYKFPDQDIINLVCADRILYIDNKFNSSEITDYSDSPKIVHYVYSKKDWVKNHKYGELWYDWERRYNNYLEHHNERTDKIDIDLIICIYNGRKFLRRALDSVKEQTIINKVLLTIVDDGSTEDYSDIIEEYSKYININYHKFRRNRGTKCARKHGLKNTSCKYLTYLDCDDYFYDKYALERLYNIISNNPECSVTIGRIYDEETKKEMNTYDYVYGLLYSRRAIERTKSHFPIKECLEDVYINSWFFSRIENEEIEMIHSNIIYHTCDNDKSTTHTYNKFKNIIWNLENVIKNTKVNGNPNYIFYNFRNYFNSANKDFGSPSNKIKWYKLVKKYYLKFKPSIDIYIETHKNEIDVQKYKTFINNILQY